MDTTRSLNMTMSSSVNSRLTALSCFVGGRGSGKSALLIEFHRRMRATGSAFSIYMSFRYLPLLQLDGSEYIGYFCFVLSKAVAGELSAQGQLVEFDLSTNEVELQMSLAKLARALDKRIVILFDDAAHIGREKPLEVFFDLFRFCPATPRRVKPQFIQVSPSSELDLTYSMIRPSLTLAGRTSQVEADISAMSSEHDTRS